MPDDTVQWVIPAITLGYSVKQDPGGRFHFFTDTVDIICRDHEWIAYDGIDPERRYALLPDALRSEI